MLGRAGEGRGLGRGRGRVGRSCNVSCASPVGLALARGAGARPVAEQGGSGNEGGGAQRAPPIWEATGCAAGPAPRCARMTNCTGQAARRGRAALGDKCVRACVRVKCVWVGAAQPQPSQLAAQRRARFSVCMCAGRVCRWCAAVGRRGVPRGAYVCTRAAPGATRAFCYDEMRPKTLVACKEKKPLIMDRWGKQGG
ncbi:MAG: hypothetical protein J3K34DRAFT_104187 [Monoraphidium minutum]|nr:MAG: hypothetical protein J3K34DRAFT_104187 [Monoraphidium minutum]